MNFFKLLVAIFCVSSLCNCKLKQDPMSDSYEYKSIDLPEGNISAGELISPLDTSNQEFKRTVVVRGSQELIKVVGHNFRGFLTMHFCVDPSGNVTYVKVDKENTMIESELNFDQLLQVFMDTYKTSPSNTASEQECGKYKFKLNLVEPSTSSRIHYNRPK